MLLPRRARKLMRTLQSEFPFLQAARPACSRTARRILRRPGDPDFASLRFIPDTLPGCYVDVGANHGQSLEAIKMVKPRALVHCYEANAGLAAQLRKRYRGRADITIHGYGLADKAHTAPLYTPVYKGCIYDGLASLDRQNAATWLNPDTLFRFSPSLLEVRESACEVRRLDDEGLAPIFIKIDVQGREHEVVVGAWETICRHEPVLMIEDLGHRPALRAQLEGIGYRQCLFNTSGFHRADDGRVANFLLMTGARAASVVRGQAGAGPAGRSPAPSVAVGPHAHRRARLHAPASTAAVGASSADEPGVGGRVIRFVSPLQRPGQRRRNCWTYGDHR